MVPFIVALYVAIKNLHINLSIHKYMLFKEYGVQSLMSSLKLKKPVRNVV